MTNPSPHDQDGAPPSEDAPAPPAALRQLQERIDAALVRELQGPLDRLTASSPVMAAPATALQDFLADGKRLRPALLLLGYQAAGGTDLAAVEGPALALELLHTCALLHDDVIDRAPTRRGRPTVHTRFAAQHREAGWSGDADGYGEAVAILLGDLAFVYADELFLGADVPHDRLLDAFRRFTHLREEVMVGQTLDLHVAAARETSREAALRIALLKSGRYSVTRPLQVGAVLAGGSADLVDGLRAYGDPVGIAFQLRDDYLGVFGESEETGKSRTSDLVEGKRTLLVAETYERADAAGRELLDRHLGDPDLRDEDAAHIRRTMGLSGAVSAVEARRFNGTQEALDALARLALPAQVHDTLEDLANWVGQRRS